MVAKEELHKILIGFVPFAICFVILILVWWEHFRFFRRFGLHDMGTILINSTLLFMVLFYVYPLKFLFTLIAGQLASTPGHDAVFSNVMQSRELMIVYGLGSAGIYFCFAALYLNAWRQRVLLRLSPLETTLTLIYFWGVFGIACIGLLCCLIARLLPPEATGNAGWFFFLIGPWMTIHGMMSGRYIRAAQARTSAEDRLPLAQHD